MSKPFHPLWLFALFSLALVVRVVFALWFGSNGLTVSDDAQAYHDLAVNLVEHHRFVTTADPPHRLDLPYATRPPLTPFVLALLYLVFGPNLFAAQLFFALVGAVSVLVVLGRNNPSLIPSMDGPSTST